MNHYSIWKFHLTSSKLVSTIVISKRDKGDAYDYFSFKNELKFSDKEFPMVSVAKKKTLMFWSFLPKIRCIAWKLKREMKCYKVNDVAFFVHHNAFLFSLKQRKALAEEQRKCLLCPKVDWKNEHNLMIVSVSVLNYHFVVSTSVPRTKRTE